MAPDNDKPLARLQALLEAEGAAHLLRGARLEPGTSRDGPALRVAGTFARSRLEGRYSACVREALGASARLVSDDPPPVRGKTDRIRLGKGNEFAARMVRAAVEGSEPLAPLLLLYGPAASGKSTLLRWAEGLAAGRAFRLDLATLIAGKSRYLMPRKKLVLIDGLETLAGKPGAQRTLCLLLDGVADRGGRCIASLRGHPRECPGLESTLACRLLGAVLVPVEAVPARGSAPPPLPSLDPASLLHRLKDAAAGAFRVERSLLDRSTKRRGIVEAKRAVIAEASRHGLPRSEIAASLGIKSSRTLQEACRWVASRSGRDARFAALVRAVGRVLPKP
ncbi:MAG: hypothetical protein ACT4PV_11515 [Planctomycetaceae bacterium]